MHSKKADITIETVVIAVLVLAVLGFIFYIFFSRGVGPLTEGLSECEARNGKCLPQCGGDFPIYGFKGCSVTEGGKKVTKSDYTCCLPAK